MKLPATKEEAARLGLPRYFSGKPCCRGHVAARYTKGRCSICVREAIANWRRENPSRYKEVARNGYYRNREKKLQRQNTYAKKHPERIRERSRRHYLRHTDKILDRGKEWRRLNKDLSKKINLRWQVANPNSHVAANNRRRAAKSLRSRRGNITGRHCANIKRTKASMCVLWLQAKTYRRAPYSAFFGRTACCR